MTKLNQNKNSFAGAEVLTRLQLKNILGGNVSETVGGVGSVQFECHCSSGGSQTSWGCIDVQGCANVGDQICPGNYSCQNVS